MTIRYVTIIGLGLMGGSLAMALRRHFPHIHLTAIDRNEVLQAALTQDIIDRGFEHPSDEALKQADLVVLATPVQTIPPLLETIAPHLQPGTRVTDVGSVKAPIVEHAQRVLPPDVHFLGGHPMTGKEQGGFQHADPLLYENALYILTPTRRLTPEWEPVFQLLEGIGARLFLIDPQTHDRLAAKISHTPQLTAIALVRLLRDLEPAYLQLGAGGFRDMTRIASSPFTPWKDILQMNRKAILDALTSLIEELDTYRQAVAEERWEEIEQAFTEAAALRNQVPQDMKGFLHPLAEVFLFAEDRPGFLHEITGILAEAGLNIKDIELLKIREGLGGTFRLAFATPEEAQEAIRKLRQAGYHAHEA